MLPNNLTYTVEEFSELFHINRSTTERYIRQGNLPVLRVGARVLITGQTVREIVRGDRVLPVAKQHSAPITSD